MHPIEPYARQAFAAGWAASGGPMTERVQAACTAAVALAVEHPDDPRIFEVTLHLGKLEGMWATLFRRREQIIAQYTARVTDAWRALITAGLFRDGLHRMRADLGLTDDSDEKPDHDAAKAAATAAALAMLRALVGAPGWAALRTAVHDAIAAGRAEGTVGAVAIAAERAGRTGLNWDKAFPLAYQQLERLADLWAGVDDWLQRLTNRAAAALARVLADKATTGAPYGEMLTAATDLLDNPDVEAVAFTVDWAMTTAANQGALGLYQKAALQSISIITAGDGRVCSACEDAEARSPWPIDQAPTLPLHPNCRCIAVATTDADLSRFASWFTDT